ncbi:MAG: tetraacyldisaccharide 4'-kinase [Bacteroidaceae bacterium]|nr:tetraacyldisaccharide 4'-kinase [Bacteroidaceae bacterium]
MEGDLIHINDWLRPLSWLYGIGVQLRNACFNAGILKETVFDCPVICIGNITVGGTGKTPHTEMLLRLLIPRYRVAVLSRGYKRKSKGYHVATLESPMTEIGDEAWQMKHKFPEAVIAVDGNRRRGIRRLLTDEATRSTQVILLDDAFQHRYVKAGLNILLTDYHRLITDDVLLPAGRLREPVVAKERAHIVVVTKCPSDMKPMDYRVVKEALSLRPHQHLFFSTFRYGALYRLFDETPGQAEELNADTHVLLLTGIASPQQMLLDLRRITRHITPLSFQDHHQFTSHDIQRLEEAFTAMQGSKRLIITTEKDAARLRLVESLSPIVRRHIHVLPVETEILRGEQQAFERQIEEQIAPCR